MIKSELINALVQQTHLGHHDVELAVSTILEHMSQTLASGGRIEVRGFGSFSVNYRSPRTGRNPATGQPVEIEGRYAVHFKPGKALRERVTKTQKAILEQPLLDTESYLVQKLSAK